MGWNHREKVGAMSIVLQPTPGTFAGPGTTTDLIPVASLDNGSDVISAQDPTLTGAIWEPNRIFLGESGNIGGNIPLRGPGGATPPALNAWPVGLLLQAAGFAEARRATAGAATAVGAGSTTTTIVLNASESAVDDALLGVPIQHATIGTGVRGFTLIRDYTGSSKAAELAETLSGAPTGNYTLPAYLGYLLGTMSSDPPLLSISVWRDKLRYDYRDCRIQSWSIDAPVANEFSQNFPSFQFTCKGIPIAETSTTTPVIPNSVIGVSVPPGRNGKFFLDKIQLGHGGVKTNINLETGAASNQNQDLGQDGYDLLSGSRTLELDLNQVDTTTFATRTKFSAQTKMPLLSTWGQGSGNQFGLMLPNIVLDPLRPGARNGYVSITGGAFPTDIDKSIAFAIVY